MANQNWLAREGGIFYIGSVPISTDAADIGDIVRIQTDNHEFDVLVDSVDGDFYTGTVSIIGPLPVLEAEGITRG